MSSPKRPNSSTRRFPPRPSLPAQNYRLADDRRLAEGWKARAEDNLAAIRLMTAIEAEGRHARPDEQERLAKFTAFGAVDLADKLFRRAGEGFAPAWEDLGVELEALVSRDDLANLKRATQYAHYTPEFMIRAIWRALRRMGFDGGRVLEPGCGTGLFFALCPEALVGKLALAGVEMDPTTASIAKLLHPNARIRHEDFTKTKLPELFDLAIGNPPFSDRTVRANDPAGELRLSLHDYFIARSVERLRPGGLAAFVTSRWTMDKVDGKARQHIAAMADLIGAVRLPEGAMHDRAGTEVVVDILLLQKRDAGTAPAGAAWDVLAEAVRAEDGETALSINRYFVEHPENGARDACAHLERLWTGLYVEASPLDAWRALGPSGSGARLPTTRPVQAHCQGDQAVVSLDHPRRDGRGRRDHQGGQLSRPRGRARPDHRRRASSRRRARRQGDGGESPRSTPGSSAA
jgi:adenine-specific DNA methylase